MRNHSEPLRALVDTLALTLALCLLGTGAEARVTRIHITSREVVADGTAFGNSGPYEKLRGTVFFEVDPFDPRNAVVFDLDKAPRNNRGLVEFSADFFILEPVDVAKGNNGLFFEVNNRGNKLSSSLFNDVLPTLDVDINTPTSLRDFGNGFLLRQGYALAWVGWEEDVLPGTNRLTVQFPVAMDHGKPIAERILVEFADAKGAAELTPRTFCTCRREFSSQWRTVARRRTALFPRGVERRERTADDRPHDDQGAPSAALRSPASGSRPRYRGCDHCHESRRPSLDGPWVARQGTEGRGEPGRDGPEGIRTPARSRAAPATGEEAHRTPSARPRPASKLRIHVDARASARWPRQDQDPASRGSRP